LLCLLNLAGFEILPAAPGSKDISALVFLSPTAKQDHNSLSILAKIDPVSRTEIDSIFTYACADAFRIREITLFYPDQLGGHLRCSRRIEGCEPLCEETITIRIKVFQDRDHD